MDRPTLIVENIRLKNTVGIMIDLNYVILHDLDIIIKDWYMYNIYIPI